MYYMRDRVRKTDEAAPRTFSLPSPAYVAVYSLRATHTPISAPLTRMV